MTEQSQTVYVSVAHRYWNSQWAQARNVQVYGRNASPEGVGSNMALTVTLVTEDGAHRAESVLATALQNLKASCDHRCFFTDIPEFENSPSTLETISLYLAEKLFSYPMPSGVRVKELKVAENDSLSCTVVAQSAVLRDSQTFLHISERHLNLWCTVQVPLNFESGLGLPRGVLWQAVRDVAPGFAEPASDIEGWGKALFAALKIKVKALCELNIDLASQQSLRVTSDT